MKQAPNPKNNKSNLPLAIIGLVLVAAVAGGWWFYSSSKKPPVNSNTNKPAKKQNDPEAAKKIYDSAPAGAQPANMLGAPMATVTVEEFADFQCGTCATVHPKMKELNSLYGGRIKFIFRNYPLQMHKNAFEAAAAAEAAGLQGKFWAMQDQLFTNQKTWSNSAEPRKLFEEYAGKIGLDVAKWQNDLTSMPVKTRIDADMNRGSALQITGTPSVFINGRQIDVPQMEVSTMRQMIDAEMQKSGASAQPNQPAS